MTGRGGESAAVTGVWPSKFVVALLLLASGITVRCT